MDICWLKDCRPEISEEIGGKAHGLGELVRANFPVPPGFVITASAYRTAVAPIAAAIDAELASDTPPQHKAERIATLFHTLILPPAIADEIDAAYAELCREAPDLPVAVRSSATAEDSAEASFAGQQETYLWVVGAQSVRQQVVHCWASLFGARAIEYRLRMKVPADGLAMAVVVQRMVPAESAGVMMTLDPVSGDRSRVYIESAFGLGEIVVRGEVDPDRFHVDKATLGTSREEIGTKLRQYCHVATQGVVSVELPAAQQGQRSLSTAEVRKLAELGLAIEAHFGRPMDVEWAIAADAASGQRQPFMLQARPETVWSRMPAAGADFGTDAGVVAGAEAAAPKAEDPLHGWSEPGEYWSTSNIGEAMPGVQTPLSATVWLPMDEDCMREFGYRFGYLTEEERRTPQDIRKRFMLFFFGRAATNVRCVSVLGDRVPGLTGPMAVAGLLGRVPEDIVFFPTKRFHGRVLRRMVLIYLRTPSQLRALVPAIESWWHASTQKVTTLDRGQTVALFKDAKQRFFDAMVVQITNTMGLVQPSLGVLDKIARRTGVPEVNSLATASGNQEMALVIDMWEASRGRLSIEEVVSRHGFHGPMEGELSTRVWREDDTPLRRMLDHYAKLDEDGDPRRGDAAREHEQAAIVQRALAAVSPWQRPWLRLTLKLARQYLPLRGVAKCSFLQAFDVMRACARQLGTLFAAEGLIAKADDVFYLTMDEMLGELPADAQQRILVRKRQRAAYQQLAVPSDWKGMPVAEPLDASNRGNNSDTVHGLGVSRGVVEGIVRVVLDPDFSEIRANEILVAPTTDPSWSSVIFLSAAIIVDIGGALSHAAVVARELGIPCIVNTRNGTRVLQTGDYVRVDGDAGIIQILDRPETVDRSSLS